MKLLKNEKGMALLMVLVLSAIMLAIMAGLLYMIMSGTQMSGIQKRYKTALEAAVGGTGISYQYISLRGEAVATNAFNSLLNSYTLNAADTTPSTCSGQNISGVTFYGLKAKLNTSTSTWSGCDRTLSINPSVSTTYDIKFQLGTIPKYNVYAKIVDTVEGNSAGDEGLIGKGVVTSGAGEVAVKSMPYLYSVEIDAENADNPQERAKLSVLYLY